MSMLVLQGLPACESGVIAVHFGFVCSKIAQVNNTLKTTLKLLIFQRLRSPDRASNVVILQSGGQRCNEVGR